MLHVALTDTVHQAQVFSSFGVLCVDVSCVCVCITRLNAPLDSIYYDRSGLPRTRVHQVRRGGVLSNTVLLMYSTYVYTVRKSYYCLFVARLTQCKLQLTVQYRYSNSVLSTTLGYCIIKRTVTGTK